MTHPQNHPHQSAALTSPDPKGTPERKRKQEIRLPPELAFASEMFSEFLQAREEHFLASLAWQIAEPRLKGDVPFRGAAAAPHVPGNAKTAESHRKAILEQSVREARMLLDLCCDDDDAAEPSDQVVE